MVNRVEIVDFLTTVEREMMLIVVSIHTCLSHVSVRAQQINETRVIR